MFNSTRELFNLEEGFRLYAHFHDSPTKPQIDMASEGDD
jgi:hypothetical protein